MELQFDEKMLEEKEKWEGTGINQWAENVVGILLRHGILRP